MAETSSLLNCRAGYRTGGSNPPASAEIRTDFKKCTIWWIHLMVRIQDSQSWHRGSIPLSTTGKPLQADVCKGNFCIIHENIHDLFYFRRCPLVGIEDFFV